jgi:hypothetical protein
MNSVTTEPIVPLAAETSEYVLPKPPRPTGGVVVVDGRSAALAAHRYATEAVRVLGDRLLLLAECQQQFLAELRQSLEALDGAVAEDARARLKAGVHGALQVLDWCDEAQQDLLATGNHAVRGWRPIDLVQFCRDFAADLHANGAPVLVAGAANRPWWGDAGKLAEVLHSGIVVVAERSGGQGAVLLEVGTTADGHSVRIAGRGEPTDDLDPVAVVVFRSAAERLGATVLPDHLGAGGTGLVLHLPSPD